MIHHTNCGMEFFTDDVMRELLGQSLDTAELGADGFHDVGSGPGSSEAAYIDWLAIPDRERKKRALDSSAFLSRWRSLGFWR